MGDGSQEAPLAVETTPELLGTGAPLYHFRCPACGRHANSPAEPPWQCSCGAWLAPGPLETSG